MSEYEMKYLLERKIVSKGNTKIMIYIKPHGFGGNVLYDRFDVSEVLMPSLVSFDLRVFDQDQSLIVNRNVVIAKDLNGAFSYSVEISPNHYIASVLTENISFNYIEDDLEEFDEITGTIDQYLGSLQILQYVSDCLKTIENEVNINFIPAYISFLNQQNLFKNITTQTDQQKLEALGFEISEYKNLALEIKQKLTRIKTLLSNLINSNKIIPSYNDFVKAKKTFGPVIAGNFEKYHQASYRYAAINNVYIRRNFENSFFTDIAAFVTTMLPESLHRNKWQFFTRVFYHFRNQIVQMADSCIYRNKYNEAFELLGMAFYVGNPLPVYVDTDNLRPRYSRACYGLYESYLRIAEKAIMAAQFGLASDYLNRASDFQGINFNYIISNASAENMYSTLFNTLLSHIDTMLMAGQLNGAVQLLDEARNITDNKQEIVFDFKRLELTQKTYLELRYYDYISKSVAEGLLGNFIQAGYFVDKAEECANEISALFPDNGPHYLIGNSVVYGLLVMADSLLLEGNNAQALDFLLALKIPPAGQKVPLRDQLLFRAIEALITEFQTGKRSLFYADELELTISKISKAMGILGPNGANTDLLQKIQWFNETAEREWCLEQQRIYQNLVSQIQQLISVKDWHHAFILLDSCLEMQGGFPNCISNDSTALILAGKYKPVQVYLRMADNLKAQLYNNGIFQSVEPYLQTDLYFEENKLERYGVVHTSLIEFLKAQNNTQMYVQCLDKLIFINEPLVALKVLHLIYESELPASQFAGYQVLLAGQLFDHDLANKQYNFGDNLFNYTSGYNQWYKYLTKRYKKLAKNR